MDKKLVSVIIPTYNRADLLKICLESLVNQTFKSFEVIVSDDGSKDHTKEIVNNFSHKLDIKFITQDNFGGPARPRNNAMKIASGVYFAFLDSDDYWYPRKLEFSVNTIGDNDILFHDLDIVKQGKVIGTVKGKSYTHDIFSDLMINHNQIPNSTVLIRRDVVDRIGFQDESKDLIAVEDADYWIRLSKISDKFIYLNKSLGVYFLGDNISISEKQISREISLYNKHINELVSSDRLLAESSHNFKIARIYHDLKKFNNSNEFYLKAFKHSNSKLKIKCLVCLMFSLLRIKI